ncbi:MAG: DoxX family membrane protein [Acidimicrobiia bacterium]
MDEFDFALNAKLSAGNEIALGLGLISGLLTSVAAAGLAATMFVAFSALGTADDLDGWVGAGIVGAGLVVAFLQLAVFWRKPVTGESPS